ncbi:hypothetical protein F5B18DRAFT_606271 [Nemania serpens]|nr:hypothetical protein F5B18DRAFT_606271 [Nemania serpens]
MPSERSGSRYFARKVSRRRVERQRQSERSSQATGAAGSSTNETAKTQPPVESKDERNKRISDIKVSAEFVRRFTEEAHDGRIPPEPSALPESFLCIHCNQLVKREENDNPWVC